MSEEKGEEMIDAIGVITCLWATVVIIALTIILFAELFGIYFLIQYILRIL